MKEDIQRVIGDLQYACRQPLFTGIVGGSSDDAATVSSPYHEREGSYFPGALDRIEEPINKKLRVEENKSTAKAASWDSILAEVSCLLPSMTSREHGQVSKLVAILLLGFFLPHSTGNDFFSSQNLSNRPRSVSSRHENQRQQSRQSETQTAESSNHNQNGVEFDLFLSLEERLESCQYRYGNEFGELDDLIVQEHLEKAFQSFLTFGLRSFLLGRPAHSTQVDIIHILAMAIHPHPSDQCIRQTTSLLEEQKSDIWEMTTRLMSSLVPNSFQINYHHRFQLVEIVNECLILPERQLESGVCQNAPLYEGAIPHLRASLYAFGMASISPYDSHLAQCAMVSLAIQSGIDHVVKEEWSRLLHRLVDDRTNYNSCPKNDTSERTITFSWTLPPCKPRFSDRTFCPHTSRGNLLRDFLIRYNKSRRFAEEDFLQFALSSLTDAIEMQVDCWTKEEDTESDLSTRQIEVLTSNQPSLVLASLLNAAKYLFHFLLPIKDTPRVVDKEEGDDEEMEESEDSHYRDMLISCGIQLVHHWHPVIVKETCTMLVLAFSYTEDMWEDYVGAVFDSIVIAVDKVNKCTERQGESVVIVEGLVSAFSQRSLTFAVNLFRILMKEKYTDGNPVVTFRLIAAIANARPIVAQKYMEEFTEHLNRIKDPSVVKHILASVLSCRRTHYFANNEDSLINLRPIIFRSSLRNWDKYMLSRHAMMTGNFGVAKEFYTELMNSASSESSFIWLSAMEKVADGEERLCANGAKSLPESTSKLRMAIGEFRSMQSLKHAYTTFQITILELRVCFLDLLTNLRQLTMEMRLTGSEPKKFTRPNLHLKNIIKLILKLGYDYMRIYKQCGLFLCQQSRSVIRTLSALCSFVARAASRIFLDSIVVNDGRSHELFVGGDISQPLTLLLKQLESFALEKVNQFVDSKIRAVTLLQIMDGILKTPVPIPRSLTHVKVLPCASLQIFCDPDTHEMKDNRIEVFPGTPIVCLATGTVPTSLISRSQIPFNSILLRYTLYSKGSHTKVFESSEKFLRTEGGPIVTSMSSGGRFFVKFKSQVLVDEGWYRLQFQLDCRDIRGGEWELPVKESPHCFTIKVLPSAAK